MGERPPAQIEALPRQIARICPRCDHHELIFAQPVGFCNVQDASIAHHSHPVTHRQQFGVIGADEQNADALCGQLIDDFIHLELGPDVKALRRFVKNQQSRLGEEPAGDDNFLLVAAGQELYRSLQRRWGDVELLDVLAAIALFACQVQEEPGEQFDQPRDGDIRGALKIKEQAICFPVFGYQAHTSSDRFGRR